MTNININQTHFFDATHNILWNRNIFEILENSKSLNTTEIISNSLFIWQEANRHCESQNNAILKWRLPNLEELTYLSKFLIETNYNPEDYLYSHLDDFSNPFWSSTEVEDSEDEVYAVYLRSGEGIEKRTIYNKCSTVFVSDSNPVIIANMNFSLDDNLISKGSNKIREIVSGKFLLNYNSIRNTLIV